MLLFRLSLSALHYNESSGRLQKVTVNRRPRHSIKYPKPKKGGYALQPVKGSPTYGTFIKPPWLIILKECYMWNKFFSQCYRNKTNGKFWDHYQVHLILVTLFFILYSDAQLASSKTSKSGTFCANK